MSDDIWRIGLVALALSLAIWALVRGTIWLSEWHWRHCPRNPDRQP